MKRKVSKQIRMRKLRKILPINRKVKLFSKTVRVIIKEQMCSKLKTRIRKKNRVLNKNR